MSVHRWLTGLCVVGACVAGLGCAAPSSGEPEPSASAVPDAPGGDGATATAPPIVPHRGKTPAAPTPPNDTPSGIADLVGSSGAQVTSYAHASDGAIYAAGTFEGSIMIGEFVLHSRGLSDVFILRSDPDGTLAWARSAGSEERERSPRVTLDTDDQGRVKVVGTSEGQMNCGDGPMSWWSGTATIFLCVFDGPTGANVTGGAFPIAP